MMKVFLLGFIVAVDAANKDCEAALSTNQVISLAGCQMLFPRETGYECTAGNALSGNDIICLEGQAAGKQLSADAGSGVAATHVCVTTHHTTNVPEGAIGNNNACAADKCTGNGNNAAKCVACNTDGVYDMTDPSYTCNTTSNTVVTAQCTNGTNASECSCRSADAMYEYTAAAGTCAFVVAQEDVAALVSGKPATNTVALTLAQAAKISVAKTATPIGAGKVVTWDGSAFDATQNFCTASKITTGNDCWCRTALGGTAANADYATVAADFTKVAGAAAPGNDCALVCEATTIGTDEIFLHKADGSECSKCGTAANALSETKACSYTGASGAGAAAYALLDVCSTPLSANCACGTTKIGASPVSRCTKVQCTKGQSYAECSRCLADDDMQPGMVCEEDATSNTVPKALKKVAACGNATDTLCNCSKNDGTASVLTGSDVCSTADGGKCDTSNGKIMLAAGAGISAPGSTFTTTEKGNLCGRCAAADYAAFDMTADKFCIEDTDDNTTNEIVDKCSPAADGTVSVDCICHGSAGMTLVKKDGTCTQATCTVAAGKAAMQATCRSCVTAGTYDMTATNFCINDPAANATGNQLISKCADSNTVAATNGCYCEGPTAGKIVAKDGTCAEYGVRCATSANPLIAASDCHSCTADADMNGATGKYCSYDATASATEVLPECPASADDVTAKCVCHQADGPAVVDVGVGNKCVQVACTVKENKALPKASCGRCAAAADAAYDMTANDWCANVASANTKTSACAAVALTAACACKTSDITADYLDGTTAGQKVCKGCTTLMKKGDLKEYKKDECQQCGSAALASTKFCFYKDDTAGKEKIVEVSKCTADDGKTATTAAEGCACMGSDSKPYHVAKDGKCDKTKKGASSGGGGGSGSSTNALLSGLAMGFVLLLKF